MLSRVHCHVQIFLSYIEATPNSLFESFKIFKTSTNSYYSLIFLNTFTCLSQLQSPEIGNSVLNVMEVCDSGKEQVAQRKNQSFFQFPPTQQEPFRKPLPAIVRTKSFIAHLQVLHHIATAKNHFVSLFLIVT